MKDLLILVVGVVAGNLITAYVLFKLLEAM
jgi:hypothetical protein